jgi:N-acetylmuramoyl-L-alanine amidase
VRRFLLATAFLMAWGLFPVGAQAQNADHAFTQAKAFAESVRGDDRKRQFRHYWLRAIERLEKVIEQHPHSPQAAQAQFLAGRLYEEMSEVSRISDDVDSAIDAYRKVVKDYSNSPAAPEAQFRIGSLFLDRRQDRTGAYVEFERVVTLFPRSAYAARARNRLTLLADAKPSPTLARSSLVNVNRVLHWSNPDSTRVAIYVGERTTFTYGFLGEDDTAGRPRRIYIDIANARLDPALREPIPIQDGLLQRARAGQFKPDTVRVVLDLESIGNYKVFPLVSPYRIIVDVYGAPAGESEAEGIIASLLRSSRGQAAEAGPARGSARGNEARIARAAAVPANPSQEIRRIVIDPGHGGRDPGAVGVGGIYEKDIALAISRKVAERARRRLGVEVILTRDADEFIPLEGRPGIARTHRGDLFISIHANSAASPQAYGIETYHLDITNDRRAIAVAARENQSSEETVSQQESIIRDLIFTSKKNDSIQLARAVQGSMVGGLSQHYDRIRDLGVKGAPFVVLIGADVPAILVETGFVSNPVEARRLQDPTYRERLADSIVSGIESYIGNLRHVTY